MSGLEPPVPAAAAEALITPAAGQKSTAERPQRRWTGWQTMGDSKPREWRRPVGLVLLALVIFLWTLTNFLASTIMADDSYSKPFFVTYISTSFFILPLIPAMMYKVYKHPEELRRWRDQWASRLRGNYTLVDQEADEQRFDESPNISSVGGPISNQNSDGPSGDSIEQNVKVAPSTSLNDTTRLTLPETAMLSLEFCMLWFLANYSVVACLQYTTVASATILTSLSPLFTLIIGATFRVEKFTIRKVIGVLASLAGVVLISTVDLSGKTSDDEHRGKFPQKSTSELALGDGLALLSAILYGMYSVFLKKRVANENRVDMVLFMGLVGVINVLVLWPGIILFHFTGIEKFGLPPTSRETGIVIGNSMGSMVSDFAWAYAVLFTSPILVTVGLTMTIPLSLVGQIILNNQRAGVWYWLGALIVVFSFLIVFVGDKEEREEEASAMPIENDPRRSEQHDHTL